MVKAALSLSRRFGKLPVRFVINKLVPALYITTGGSYSLHVHEQTGPPPYGVLFPDWIK